MLGPQQADSEATIADLGRGEFECHSGVID